MRRICELSTEDFEEPPNDQKAWNVDRIQCWADASDGEDEQIFRSFAANFQISLSPMPSELANNIPKRAETSVLGCEWQREVRRPRRQKRIYSRSLLLQARPPGTRQPGQLTTRRVNELSFPKPAVEQIQFCIKPGAVHFYDPALAATAFEAVLSWLEPGIAQAESWTEKGLEELCCPFQRCRKAWQEETSDESPDSLEISPTRWWPWLLIWALLLFLSYVLQKPAVQAARPSASFADLGLKT
eukprot:s272_g10.t1